MVVGIGCCCSSSWCWSLLSLPRNNLRESLVVPRRRRRWPSDENGGADGDGNAPFCDERRETKRDRWVDRALLVELLSIKIINGSNVNLILVSMRYLPAACTGSLNSLNFTSVKISVKSSVKIKNINYRAHQYFFFESISVQSWSVIFSRDRWSSCSIAFILLSKIWLLWCIFISFGPPIETTQT